MITQELGHTHTRTPYLLLSHSTLCALVMLCGSKAGICNRSCRLWRFTIAATTGEHRESPHTRHHDDRASYSADFYLLDIQKMTRGSTLTGDGSAAAPPPPLPQAPHPLLHTPYPGTWSWLK